MIRKLQRKLVMAAMLSLLLVLTVILGVVGTLNYHQIVADADSILALLQENDGSFPSGNLPETGMPKGNRRFSPELPYETRFFAVFLTADGDVLSVNTGKIAAVDTTTAIAYAKSAVSTGRERGFLGDYRYTIYTAREETHIIFLDYGREMGTFRTFLFTSVGVSLAGLLAVLLLLLFFSGRIVKPFSENYEKQKQFITNAGHELKTPLTIIDADAEVLEMDIGENEWLRDIQAQTKRLAQLTNSLVLLSRAEERPQTEWIEFPVSDLVEETVEAFQAPARTRHKTLTSHVQPMLSMQGDEKAIRELVSILLDNAIKYSNDEGRIELTLERQKNALRLSVFNTADAVSREHLSRLFDRFYRGDGSRNSQTGGYGLGLSIASAIVAAHKGRITAETPDGKSLVIVAIFPQ